MELEKILNQTKQFIVKEGDAVNRDKSKIKIYKIHPDQVDISTNLDRRVEKNFFKFIKKNFPDHGFQGEEISELNHERKYTWVLDPIDGTKYFSKGVPLWSISASLVNEKTKEILLGIIYNPNSRQLYWATKNRGAFLNGHRLSTSPELDPKKIQISVDLPRPSQDRGRLEKKSLPILSKLVKKFYRVRMIGSGANSLAWLSQGMFGAYVSLYRSPQKWVDIPAGLIIAQESGAEIVTKKTSAKTTHVIVGRKKIVQIIEAIIG